MSVADDIISALEIGCPVRAAELLIGATDAGSRYLKHRLRSGDFAIPLPESSELRESLESLAGRPMPSLEPKPGVLCLAAYNLAGETIGSVQQLEVIRSRPRDWKGFEVGCSKGHQAAIAWILERAGLFDVSGPRCFVPEGIAPQKLSTEFRGREGESAGLAAAIATVWEATTEQAPMFIAATAQVDNQGKLHSVASVEEKTSAMIREAPYVTHLVVSEMDASRVCTLPPSIKLVSAASVKHALDSLFPDLDFLNLASLQPEEAAEKARELEFSRQHRPALALASEILKTRESWNLDSWNEFSTEVTARMIVAGNCTHRGKAKDARREFEMIDVLLAKHGEDELDLDTRCTLAAFRASTEIDLLSPEHGVKACELLSENYRDASKLPRLALLGSWSRALTAVGRREEAIAKAREQTKVPLSWRDKSHLFQAYCNLVGAILSGLPVQAAALEEVRELLNKAESFNAGLLDTEARRANEEFLKLWRARYYARSGQADLAKTLLPPHSSGGFPLHHIRRFVGEGLLREGRVEEALEELKEARERIPSWCQGFERVVLLTSGAVEARARIEHGVPGWQQAAQSFVVVYQDWMEEQGKSALAMSTVRADQFLAKSLRAIPY